MNAIPNLPWSEQYRVVARKCDAFEARCIPEPNCGCWLWFGMKQGGRDYGIFAFAGKSQRAHRAAWEIYCGEIPAGVNVLHRCDNPPCVNPEHLFLGTQRDNIADRTAKGRGRPGQGEAVYNAKLTASDVRAIRATPYTRSTLSALADQYGVNRASIHKVITRRTWKHV